MRTLIAVAVLLCAQTAPATAADKPKKTEVKAAKAEKVEKLALCEQPTIQAMWKKNNELRKAAGLPAQKLSPKLTRLAQDWANYMALTGNYTHNYGHPYPEIIHTGPTTVEGAFDGWVRSSPHYAIMLSANSCAGFGYQVSAGGQPYWVGVYGNLVDPGEEKTPQSDEDAVEESHENEPAEDEAAPPEAPQQDETTANEGVTYTRARHRRFSCLRLLRRR